MNNLFGKWIVQRYRGETRFQCPVCGTTYAVSNLYNPYKFARTPCKKCNANNGGFINEPKSIR